MKTLSSVLILMLSTSAIANEALDACIAKAQNYGDSRSPQSVPANCYNEVLKYKNHKNYDQAEDGLTVSTGSQNILYNIHFKLNEENKAIISGVYMISGKKSKLEKILAVEVNKEDNRVYILNNSKLTKSILSYPLDFKGNIAPRRELASVELDKASNIKIDRVNEELYAFSNEEGWIKVFNLYADIHSKKPEHSTKTKRSLEVYSKYILKPIDLAFYKENIYVLESDKISIFSRIPSSNLVPKQVYNTPNRLPADISTIDYDKELNTLILIDKNKKVHKLPIDEYGFIK